MANPKWSKLNLDADGSQFLGQSDVVDVLAVDNTVGGFANPTTSSWWGCAKDGKHYANGVECGFGKFGSFPPAAWNFEAWSVAGQDPLACASLPANSILAVTADGEFTIGNSVDAVGFQVYGIIDSQFKWCLLSGDFDIQLDFANLTSIGGGYVHFAFTIYRNQGGTGGANIVYAYLQTGGEYKSQAYSNGVASAWSSVVTGDVNGKLRITRVAGTPHVYYWNAGWVELANYPGWPAGTDPVLIRCYWAAFNCHGSLEVSNITLNSGSTSNLAGWARETPTIDVRGTKAAMPDHFVIVCESDGDGCLDIIDADDDKMWMRFNVGANNLFDNPWSAHPIRGSWNDGVLIVANKGTADGYGVLIDWVTGYVRTYRDAVSNPGGLYSLHVSRADGQIPLRNDAMGWGGGLDANWACPSNAVQDVDIIQIGVNEYKAVACTNTGVAIFKWKRLWYTTAYTKATYAVLLNFVTCKFGPDGTFYYMTLADVYSTSMVNWEAAMGGNFVPDATVPLPGTRVLGWQQRLVVYDTNKIFVPANEGIYRSVWPAAFALYYGKAGSGAIYEILPNYDRIEDIAFIGPSNLVCTLVDGANYYAGLIDLVANTLIGINNITAGVVSEPLAITAYLEP